MVEATARFDAEHGIAIVQTTEGGVRTTDIVVGGPFNVRIEVELQPGETLLGMAHTHPEVDTGPYFSTGDIQTARDLGAPVYLIQPKSYGAGVLIYEPKRNSIYPAP